MTSFQLFHGVLLVLLILAAFLVATAAVVIVHRLVNQHKQQLDAVDESKLQAAIYEALDGASHWMELNPRQRSLLQRLMVRIALQVKGETRATLQKHYRDLGLLEEDLNCLKSRRVVRRLHAMDRLEVMADPSTNSSLRLALQDKSPVIRIRAARLLFMLGSSNLDEVIAVLHPSQHLMTRFFAQTLVDMGESAIPALIAYVNEHPFASNVGLIVRIVGETKAEYVIDHLIAWLRSQSDEVRINAVRALSSFGRPELAPYIEKCVHDANSVVRMMAIRGLGQLGG